MLTLNNTNTKDDEVSLLIDQLYNDLMMLRFEYMGLRKKGQKDLDNMLETIVNLNEDFESLIKSHTLYLRFKKATGHARPNHSTEMLLKIQEIKANVKGIVSQVPKS